VTRGRRAKMPALRAASAVPLMALIGSVVLSACGLEASAGAGQVLFQDDFSRSLSGWDRHHDAVYEADYHLDLYAIQVNPANTDAWSTPGLNFGNVLVQVEASKAEGTDDNLFGVICRYQDPRNFYFFVISSDGYAGIGVNKEGRRQLLSGEALLPSTAVRQGQAGNVVRADCLGYDLRLYINGVLVAEAQAAEWPAGDVGMIAGTYDTPGVRIYFDNFSVVQP